MATFDDDHPLESLSNHISTEQSTRPQSGSSTTSLISSFRLPLSRALVGRNNAADDDAVYNFYHGYGYDSDSDDYGFEGWGYEEYDSDLSDLIVSNETDIAGLVRILQGDTQDSDSNSSRSSSNSSRNNTNTNIEEDSLSEDSDSTSYSPTSSLAEIYINTLLDDYPPSHTGSPPPSPTRQNNRLPEADQRSTSQTSMPQTRRRPSAHAVAATAAATAAASSSASDSAAQRRTHAPIETVDSDDEGGDADADVSASTSSTSTSTGTPLFPATWNFPPSEEPSLFPQQPSPSTPSSSTHAADSAGCPNPRSTRKRRRGSGEATASESASGSASTSANTRPAAHNVSWPHTRGRFIASPSRHVVDDGEVETINLTDMESSQSIRDKMKADAEKKEKEKRPEPPRVESIKLSAFQCVICMDDVTNLTVTHCGHLFCGECLHSSLHINVSKSICPICRQKIETRGRAGNKSTRSYFALELKLVPRNKGKEPVRP